jgi:hypothetical protein
VTLPLSNRKAASITVIAACLAAVGTARADTVYNFTSPGGAVGAYGPVSLNVGFQLTLADTFLPESFSRQCYANGCFGSGDFTDFSLSLTLNGARFGALGSAGDSFGETDTGMINGDSGSLVWNTSTNDVSLTFGQGVWTATVDNDFIEAGCGPVGCVASGTLAQVPEPAALGVFAAGIFGLAAMRRRRDA